jgi:hypothetical protein
MKKVRRNDLCPCGSGLKYKKCCGMSPLVKLEGLTPGLRMKGGVCFDPDDQGFLVIVHIWDNTACQGDPDEWRAPQVFSSEDDAMQYYKASIRPVLERMMSEITEKRSGGFSLHRKLEE